jgi:hypothetical protein
MFSSLLKRKRAKSETPSQPEGHRAQTVLSDLQLIILSRAAQHPVGHVAIDGLSDAAAARKAIDALVLRDMLVARTPDAMGNDGILSESGAEAWSITLDGLKSIGIDPSEMNSGYQQAMSAVTDDEPRPSAEVGGNIGGTTAEVRSTKGAKKRSQTSPLEGSVEREGHTPANGEIGAPDLRKPPTGIVPETNRTRMIDLLLRVKGATIAEIVDATGWLPHSARAALTGLRKRGFTLVRETGTNGASSSYRIEQHTTSSPAVEV